MAKSKGKPLKGNKKIDQDKIPSGKKQSKLNVPGEVKSLGKKKK